ncbi:YiiD C-terminal domain-containing protein [Pseudomonas syringae]|uniref:YiiD C-terminal domain-containing protein n=2 Tax=Pseudomonas syringae TaxID=317 RepID=UPI000BB5C3E8|nr:YiiD C-terminal domain-containing protein [Pseudomonas syringae]MCK9704596.1 thioesterase domain-containing protein [Pseudomonas syringae pv. syringae]MCK9759529.1 thioesterase domain-containing protein [Pseudomonas syringae pv. syringae]MCK9774639.1 thioesterase domain-containing protein [Pseudomonas syringae pv. syringae]MCK9779559.1 thioesterase domain-containing protein [Pseudomonas syringae pv. syringae]PBP29938.1 thioesterase [Pseudomonas syringae]
MTPIEPEHDAAHALEQVLHHDIPLTREMGMRVIDWHNQTLRLHLPLAPNVNHKSTLFGGSLYCGAVLAGWGWLHLRLREAGITDGHIVIQDGQISYPLPVRSDAIVRCDAPELAQWDKFIATYQRRGRARLTLHTGISEQDGKEQAVRFVGQFVLHR